MSRIKQLIKKIPFLAFCAAIVGKIIPGFWRYRNLVKRFGKDITILRTAWHGTGDYYICGMYLHEYLRLNEITDYVFLISDVGSEAKVMELFNEYQGHILKIHSVENLSRFSEFMQREKPLCKSFERSDHLTFIGENLKGYKGLTLMDFYVNYGFGFQIEPVAYMPNFSQDIERIRVQMHDKGLVSGKTVLLAPYSTCSKTYLPPNLLWEHIAAYLQKLGYAVATNCFGTEEPVKGTITLSVEYSDIVPFLNNAGGFIGIRSGLCDVISRSSCHKIIIHPDKSDFWPNGRAKAFVGLCVMGLDDAAVDLTYRGDIEALEFEVLNLINAWSLMESE